MVADQQRPAALWDVVAAVHLDAVERMRQHPYQQTKKGIRQQSRGVDGSRQGGDAADQKDHWWTEMHDSRKEIVNAGRRKNPRKRKPIRGGEHRALIAFRGTML